jgi:aspartate aminotransferase-like enzyme
MGESARRGSVLSVLSALEDALRAEGRTVAPGAALSAAAGVYGT